MSTMHPQQFGYVEERPIQNLTVSDLERLAKAGVKMEFKDIARQVVPDLTVPTPPPYDIPRTLEDSFWERWRRAHVSAFHSPVLTPYNIHASQYGDKVYVFVCPPDREPFIIEDVATIYPSDALMAKLALLEKVSK